MKKIFCIWLFIISISITSLAGLKDVAAQVIIRDSLVISQTTIATTYPFGVLPYALQGKVNKFERAFSSKLKEQIDRPSTLDLLTTVPETDSIMTIQPGAQEGIDALVAMAEDPKRRLEDHNAGTAWIMDLAYQIDPYWGGALIHRCYIKFDLPQIVGHTIIRAELSLYPFDTTRFPYAGAGENEFFVNRVVSDWKEDLITWNNQPAVASTAEGEDYIRGSRTPSEVLVTILDITEMAQYWVANPDENFGLGLRLQFEDSTGLATPTWRTKLVSWRTSDYPEGPHPKLVLYLKSDLNTFEVTITPDSIKHDEATIINIQAKDSDSNDIVIPDTTPLNFQLNIAGQLHGNLIAPDSTQAKSLNGITYADVKANKVKYIANGQEPDSTNAILISVSQQDQPEITGSGKLVIETTFSHFIVNIDASVLAHLNEDTTSILVQAQNSDSVDVVISENTLVNFTLDSNGVHHGNFIAPDGSQAKSLTGITYADAKAGKVKYVANGKTEAEIEWIKIIISLNSNVIVTGFDSVQVMCLLLPTRFAQYDPTWGSDVYDTHIKKITGTDTTYYTISSKGCALSAIAMTLNAYGTEVDPGKLNSWMNDNNGFRGSSVFWPSIRRYKGNKTVKYKKGIGDGLRANNPVSKDSIDYYIKQCNAIVAQVKNPDSKGQHWVVITNKKDETYQIVDPTRDKKTKKVRKILEPYSNNVYKFVIYEVKKKGQQ